MSPKPLLIAFTFVIVLMMTIETEAKRIGCASFGHSCYGGHGKRSESAVNLQEVDTSDQPPLPVVRFLQRRFSIQQDASANEMIEREKEAKLVILGVISGVIEEYMKKLSAVEQETS